MYCAELVVGRELVGFAHEIIEHADRQGFVVRCHDFPMLRCSNDESGGPELLPHCPWRGRICHATDPKERGGGNDTIEVEKQGFKSFGIQLLHENGHALWAEVISMVNHWGRIT